MKKFVITFFIISIFSIQYAQPLSQHQREILQLQDQRSLGNGKLVSFLKDHDVHLRYKAAIALANIQDPTTVDALASSLVDSAINVRTASALALGQIGTEKAADALLASLSSEKNPDVIARMLEAMGKCGTPKHLDSLLSLGSQDSAIFPRKEFATCIARFAIRKIKTERSIWKCFEILNTKSSEECSAALFALWRSAPYGLIDLEISKHKEELISFAHYDSDVRIQLATLLGRLKSKDSREILDTLEKAEEKTNDWHVWVQIVRARGVLSTLDEMLSKYQEYLSLKNDHIKIATLQALSAFNYPLIAQANLLDSMRLTLRTLANDTDEIEAVRGETLVALGKHFPKELEFFNAWVSDDRISPWLKAKLLEGTAQQRTKEHLIILRRCLDHTSTRVAMAAWDFIGPYLNRQIMKNIGIDSIEYSIVIKDIFDKARKVLAKNDMGIITIVANLFSDTLVFSNFKTAGFSDRVVDELILAFNNLTKNDDAEAKQAVLQALGKINNIRALPFLEKELTDPDRAMAAEAAASLRLINGIDYSNRLLPQLIPSRNEDDWNLLEGIGLKQHVLFVTNRGEFTIELLKEHAPFTVLSFVKLVNRKFYNGLNFHRVVPDFVVQGGDPRGDGWGGPGYKMRTEISTVNYERGSCGMASAGKDTEGSQFFITHIPTPHLDGRYTIFAKVIKGMSVVDRLQIGDVITSVELIGE